MTKIEGWPMCAICNKPVDKVEAHDSFERHGKLFRVFCHGDVEEQWLTDWQAVVTDQISFGMAFYRQALPDESSAPQLTHIPAGEVHEQ